MFRALLDSSRCYHTASVFDPMSARIAADLGFADGSHFGRAFKARFGVTPAAFRRTAAPPARASGDGEGRVFEAP